MPFARIDRLRQKLAICIAHAFIDIFPRCSSRRMTVHDARGALLIPRDARKANPACNANSKPLETPRPYRLQDGNVRALIPYKPAISRPELILISGFGVCYFAIRLACPARREMDA